MANAELVEHLKRKGVLKNPVIVRAFTEVDRADFMPEAYRRAAYEDNAFPIGYGATISQPYTVAFMLELLEPKEGEKILDVGSGSGWTTALLARIAGEKGSVIGTEIVPELVEFGKTNLGKYGFKNVRIEPAGKEVGLSSEAPFDKILVSASGSELPQPLVEQLKAGGPASTRGEPTRGGRMVIPLGLSVWKMEKTEFGKLEMEEFPGFVFVPLQNH